jgi:plastocyanin
MGSRPRERRFVSRVGDAARRRLLFALPLGIAAVFLVPTASPAADPAIEAAAGSYGSYYWSPAGAEVAAGGSVTFKNPSASVLHGVVWTSGPEKPKCAGVPIDDFKTSWSGGCAFEQAGAYAFKCTVHPEMIGKITVSASGATPSPTPGTPGSPGSPGTPGSQPDGPALQSLDVAKRQRGSSVKGSIDVSQSGAGGRLKVDLLANRAKLLGPGQGGKMRVGQLTRSSLSQGHVSFRVPLKGVARSVLKREGSLSLQVKITVIPPQGEAVKRTRGVVLHV